MDGHGERPATTTTGDDGPGSGPAAGRGPGPGGAGSRPAAASELCRMTATRLLAGYRSGEFGPEEVTRATLARIEETEAEINAFVRVEAEAALATARESAERWRRGEPAGLLDGVPVTVKDILLMRGGPTRRGSLSSPTADVTEDAPSVARLREHGAVLLGRTTTPEFGWKGVTDSPLSGVTTNPYDPTRTAGGSSGGGAAAVSLGEGPLALGTDGGGSVRIPASFCGIFGLKPTYGRVPIYPASAFGTLAHVGPMARDAADAALLLDVISGPDPRDWSQLAPPQGSFSELLRASGGDGTEGLRGLRVAWSPTFGGQVDVHPEVARAVAAAVARMAELGAHVEEADPGFADPVDAFHTLWFSGAARVTQHLDEAQRALLDPDLREICEEGAARSALEYLAAVDVRMDLGRRMGAFHADHDLLVTPTVPLTAFGAGREVPEGSGMRRWTEWTPFTYPFNLTQQPAVSLPVGVDGTGLPVGLQLVAARHRDDVLLRASHALYAAGVAGLPGSLLL